MKTKLSKALIRVEALCKSQQLRLTVKRKQVLTVLLKTGQAISAYEIADNYLEEFQEKIPVMSVYRILDFLVGADFVHKLQSTNNFIACSHLSCEHQHDLPQFLICIKCNQVEEIAINANIIQQLKQSVNKTGFQLKQHQLELSGHCSRCKK